MDIKFDYGRRLLLIEGKPLPLDEFDAFLMEQWEPLVRANFLQAITDNSTGKTRFTYEWGTIHAVCEQGVAPVEEFLQSRGIIIKASKPNATPKSLFDL